MEWHVRLSGDNYDLKDLSKVCKSKEMLIEKGDDYYLLKSTEFNNSLNDEGVYRKAKGLLTLINGAAVITLGSHEPLRVESVVKIDDEGKKYFYGFGSFKASCSIGRLEMTMKKANGTVYEINQAAPVPRWIKVAKNNEKVAKVLRLFSENKLDWNKLNLILEDVQGNVGSLIHKNRWATKTNINRFTQTVQLYRHGGKGLKKIKWQPPKNPMDFHEAKAFITSIITNWINSKNIGENSSAI